MVVSLINDRPNIKNFSYSDTLQRWTRATNIRLRLLRPTTLHSHSIIHDGDDKSVTRRYFYSIRDIGIGGHCQCNGKFIIRISYRYIEIASKYVYESDMNKSIGFFSDLSIVFLFVS